MVVLKVAQEGLSEVEWSWWDGHTSSSLAVIKSLKDESGTLDGCLHA